MTYRIRGRDCRGNMTQAADRAAFANYFWSLETINRRYNMPVKWTYETAWSFWKKMTRAERELYS